MAEFKSTLKSELEQLREELARDPRCQRIALIEKLLETYEISSVPPVSEPSNGRVELRGETKEARAKREVVELLKTGPKSRRVLLEALLAKQILGSEKSPIKTLAKFFGKWPEVRSDGRGLWFLAPP